MSTTEPYAPPPLPSPFTNTTPPPTLLTQGAEAHLYKTITFFSPSTPAALKIRPSKAYRHPILDRRLTRQRILQEARCLVKLSREGVSVPAVLAVDWEGQGGESGIGGAWLLMEWVDGVVVRVVLERWERWMTKKTKTKGGQIRFDEQQKRKRREEEEEEDEEDEEGTRVRGLMRKIGYTVGGLHKAGVIHGDLTTSNLILRPMVTQRSEEKEEQFIQDSAGDDVKNPSMDGEIVLIDFGLAGQSAQDEDQAVDLYVLERAIGSTHPRSEPYFGELLQGYRECYKGASSVLRRLEDVRMRGRKRSMVG